MNLILVGFKRTGKTTYGKLLAEKLKWPFLDTDDLIIEAYHKEGHPKLEIHEVHQKLTEEDFRRLEEQVVSKLQVNHFIIAVGGGTLISAKNQKHLKKIGKIVYLKRTEEQVKRSLSLGRIPSFLDTGDFEASFRVMYQKREPLFSQLKDYEIEVSHSQNGEVLDALLAIASEIS